MLRTEATEGKRAMGDAGGREATGDKRGMGKGAGGLKWRL